MSIEKLKEIFSRLATVDSPFGFEEPMIKYFKAALEAIVDEVHANPRGNVVGVQLGSDPDAPRVALVAHMDQVGFVVFNIDSRGFLRFRKLGSPTHGAIQGQRVCLATEKGPVYGVVGIKPGHVTKPDEANTIPPIEELYIDIGAKSRDEAEDMGIRQGTPFVIKAQPLELANDLISSPGVDDKAGLTALLAVAEALKDEDIPATVYYIGTVEEESGLRGAGVALHNLEVDAAVAVDTAPSGWQPDVVMRDVVYEVGKGPAIHIGEIGRTRTWIYHPKLLNWLKEAAEAEGINYQSSYQLGGTDASAMAQTKGGIPAITVGVPRKYSHSPVETFDLKDMADLVKIIVSALKRLKPSFDFYRI